MLKECPECHNQVSDKAYCCPRCGYPVNGTTKQSQPSQSRKRKRLPNGFGSIVKRNNQNLRKPYYARVCTGKDPFGNYILKSLKPDSSFKTYEEAYAALIKYNENPYSLEDTITFYELYEKWTTDYFAKTATKQASQRTITSAFAYCTPLYNMRVTDVHTYHLKNCIDDASVIRDGKKVVASSNIKSRIKSVFNLMFDYAVEYEICDRNYARAFSLSGEIVSDKTKNTKNHIAFSEKEIKTLFDNINYPYVKIVIVGIYTGFRPSELCNLLVTNVDLKNNLIIGGMKTKAGTDRTVPIHPKIKDIITAFINEAVIEGRERLFGCPDGVASKVLTYDKYRRRFIDIIATFKMDPMHSAHDTRKTFVTLAKQSNVDEYALKRIVGHRIVDITESVYTERSNEWLFKEICKIK